MELGVKVALHEYSSFLFLRKFSFLRGFNADIGKKSSVWLVTHGLLLCQSEL
jgi:hypothetical protein